MKSNGTAQKTQIWTYTVTVIWFSAKVSKYILEKTASSTSNTG
jgi:hypothetical protein